MTAPFIDKLAWLYLKEGKLLSTRSKGKSVYYIPGGKREKGETDQQALVREIREELSVDLVADSIQYAGRFKDQAHGHAQGIEVQMTCYWAEYSGKLAPAAEIAEMVWLTYADHEKISPVDKLIFDWLHEQKLLA